MNAARPNKPVRKRYFGMTGHQVILLGFMALMNCLVIGVAFVLMIEPPATIRPVGNTTQSAQAIRPTDIGSPMGTTAADDCRSGAAVYFVDLQPLLKRLAAILDFEKPVPEIAPVIENIRQVSEDIRGIPVPPCALPARDTLLAGLERYTNALSNLMNEQDSAAFNEAQARAGAEIQTGLSQLQALAEGQPTPTQVSTIVIPPSLTPRSPTWTPTAHPTATPTKQPTPTLDRECESVLVWYATNSDTLEGFTRLFDELASFFKTGASDPEAPTKLRAFALGFWDIARDLRAGYKPIDLLNPINDWIDGMEDHAEALWELADALDRSDVDGIERAGEKASRALAVEQQAFSSIEKAYQKCKR